MEPDEKIINNPDAEQILESEANQQETAENSTIKNKQPGTTLGSAFGLIVAIPVGIYSYVNSPSRYSAEKLEKKAQEYTEKEIKKATKKAKRNLTEEERTVLYDKAQMDFHENYVRDPRSRDRASQLAKNPKNKNNYLLAAIENENNRKSIVGATKNKIQSKINIPTPIIPAGNENIQKDLTTFAGKAPSEKVPIGGPTAPSVSPVTRAGAPSVPGRTTPRIPGNKRGVPKPGLPGGLPNPVQAMRTFFLSPTNIVILSLGMIFVSVFLIVFIYGGGGGGGGGVGGGQPGQGGQGSASDSGSLTGTYYVPSEVFYCQGDGASWARTPYDSGNYATKGCATTSMAMIVSSYGYTKTPDQVGQAFDRNGWVWYLPNKGCGGDGLDSHGCTGTKLPIMRSLSSWLSSIGFETPGVYVAHEGPLSLTLAKKFTDNHYLLYAGVSNWPGVGGHSIVIEFVDPTTGAIRVRDPNNCRTKFVTVNQNTTIGNDGKPLSWYFAIPIKPK
jgi:hypothetical protein